MRNENGSIDWSRTEEAAHGMTRDELHGARQDIRETLPAADDLDRENGTDNGGYYRDVASVYYMELNRRGEL